MLSRLFTSLRQTRTIAELESFHRAEMRDAGVLDADLRAFLNGR
ncbi:MAG: hypothetical protein AAFR44_08860 [Pseudomonadota bacterium]